MNRFPKNFMLGMTILMVTQPIAYAGWFDFFKPSTICGLVSKVEATWYAKLACVATAAAAFFGYQWWQSSRANGDLRKELINSKKETERLQSSYKRATAADDSKQKAITAYYQTNQKAITAYYETKISEQKQKCQTWSSRVQTELQNVLDENKRLKEENSQRKQSSERSAQEQKTGGSCEAQH